MNFLAVIWAVHIWSAQIYPAYSADRVTDAVARVVLKNEQGLNEPPPEEFKKPLGVLVTFIDDKWASLCNAVNGRPSAKQGWIYTARHCWPKNRTQGAKARVFFIGFHARSNKQVSLELSENPVPLQIKTSDGKTFEADVLKVGVSAEQARMFGQSDVLTPTKRTTPEKLDAWVYKFDRESDAHPDSGSGPVSLTLTRFSVDGWPAKSPSFLVEHGRLSQTFSLSYSKQGRKTEELFGLYLEGTLPPESSSGGLLFNDKNAPAGILHSTLSANTFRASWDIDLLFRFERAAKSQGFATPLDEKGFQFALVSPDGHAEDFDLQSEKRLYGVALDLGAAQEMLQRSGSDFLDR